MKNRFNELVKQILNGLWEEDPVDSSFLGIRAYDGILPRMDTDSREVYHSQRSGFLEALKEFDGRRDELDDERRLDLDLISSTLEVSLYADNCFRLPERRADTYPSQAMFGVYLLALRDFAPFELRMESVRDRLKDTPRYLAEGGENLERGENIPAVWTETGLLVAESGEGFYSSLIPSLAERAPSLRSDLLAAAGKAGEAMREYSDFLKERLMARSDGDFAVGREAFDYLLKRKHHLPYDAQHLKEIGEEAVFATQNRLREVASEINPGKSWAEVVAELKKDHPRPEGVLEAYRKQMEEARRFVIDKDLVTLPPGEELEVVETPTFERATIPYAAYIPAAPFEERQDGFFWVTPVEKDAPAERREDQLQGHCSWGIPITALHEGYPGHHLQLCTANRVESHFRRQFYSTVFIEGWALYCEEMMEEQGFVTDPRQVLLRLKDQLWRACRVVIDVGLHCFGMTFDEAVAELVDVAKLERANAVSEVRRYTQTPTQPMSYLIGKREINCLRDDVRKAEGANFDLKDFHDRLLSLGSIPIAFIRKHLLSS